MEVHVVLVLLASVICISEISPVVASVVAGGGDRRPSGGGERRPSDPGRVDPNAGESYMDRYGPGSEPSSPTRDRYPSPSRSNSLPNGRTGDSRGGSRRPSDVGRVDPNAGESYMDRYGPGSEPSSPTRDRYPSPSRSNSLPNGRTGDRYNPGPSRSNSLPNGDRYDTNRDRYDTSRDRYDSNSRDRYQPAPLPGDRYDTNRDRYEPSRDRYDNDRDRYDNDRDRYDNNRGPNTRPDNNPRPNTRPDRPGDRYNPRPGPETEGPQKPRDCPTTLNRWESMMDRCLSPLTTLPRGSSVVNKCRAYRESEPCVDGLMLCKRDNPRLDYYKSKAIETWRDMEREAETYGVCHGI